MKIVYLLAATAAAVTLAAPAEATWWFMPKPKPPVVTPTPPSHPGNPTAVPEPGMLGLFALGAGGLIVARRSRRRED